MRSEKCGADQPGTARTFRDGRHNRPAERIKTARKQLLQHGAGKEDLQADGDEDKAAGKFCFRFIAGSKDGADLDSGGRKAEGDDADRRYSREELDLQKSETDADRQSVDAGGDG